MLNFILSLKNKLFILTSIVLLIFAVSFKNCKKDDAQTIRKVSTTEKASSDYHEEINSNVSAENININIKKPKGTNVTLTADKISLGSSKKISDAESLEKMIDELESIDLEKMIDELESIDEEKKAQFGVSLIPSWNLRRETLNLGISTYLNYSDYLNFGPFINIEKFDGRLIFLNAGIKLGLFGFDVIPNYNFDQSTFNLALSYKFLISDKINIGPFLNSNLRIAENVGISIGYEF